MAPTLPGTAARASAGRRPVPSPWRLLAAGLDPSGRTGPAAFAAVALPAAALWALRAWGPEAVPGWSRAWEAAAALPLALLLVPALGHLLRRLNDAGGRGWWAWLLLAPGARWALLLALALWPPSQRRRRGSGAARLLALGAAGAASLVLCLSLLWTALPVAAGGMAPALLPGDLVLLRRAPLALARGDVVAFRLGAEGEARVARVIGLPGERVAVAAGVPAIDGAPAARAEDGWWTRPFAEEGPAGVMPICGNGAVGLGAPCTTRRLRETLPGGAAFAVLDAGPRPLDEAAEVIVPPRALFVLGDDRDAAQDSRRAVGAQGTGAVPLSAVMGRVDRVLLSTAAASPWDPRGWRPSRTGEGVE